MLRENHRRQAVDRVAAGGLWQDDDLVFCSPTGTALDAANVWRAFRLITRKAKIGEDWTPRELRHSFVSMKIKMGLRSDAPIPPSDC